MEAQKKTLLHDGNHSLEITDTIRYAKCTVTNDSNKRREMESTIFHDTIMDDNKHETIRYDTIKTD